MDNNILPHNLLAGAQLSVGVRGASMYLPSEPGQAKKASWVRHCENSLPFRLSELRIGNEVTILEDPVAFPRKDLESPQSPNDGLFFGEEDETEAEERWKSAIVKGLNWERLSPVIPSNLQVFKEVSCSEEHMYDVRQGSPASQHDYVPDALVADLTCSDYFEAARKGYQRKSEKLHMFDPIINELFAIGSIHTTAALRNSNDQQHIIAYSSGETNSILKVLIMPEDKLHMKDDAQWLRRHIKNNEDDNETGIQAINLQSQIKSIKIPDISALLGRSSDTLGVLTENALHFIKIESIDLQTNQLIYSAYGPLQFVTFGDFPFADFAFNPWDLHQFAVVDIRGNWGIARLPKSNKAGNKIRLLPNLKGSIFDPEELSNWKRIEWSSSYSRLLIMDSSKLVELDFENDWQLEVVQAKTWSSLRDYRRIDDDFGVLLTSKEIMIVGTKKSSEQIVRLVSWKHCLDPSDQTLRLSTQKIPIDSKILILSCVFSRGHNKIYMHGFVYDEKRSLLQSMKGPVLHRLRTVDGGVYSVHILPSVNDNSWLRMESETQDMWLNLFVKENKSGKLLHFFLTNTETLIVENSPPAVTAIQASGWNIFQHLGNDDTIKSFIEHFKISPHIVNHRDSEVQDSDVFQSFGYKLSEIINDVVGSWDPNEKMLKHRQPLLEDLMAVPTNYESIEELGSLLEQLSEYYNDAGVIFTNFATISKLILQENTQNLDTFYNKLLQCWDIVTPHSHQLTRKVFDRIVWSTLRFYKPEMYEEVESKLQESMCEPYSEILRLWDEEEFVNFGENLSADRVAQQNSQPQFLFNSQSQIPTIKSSQSKAFKRVRPARSSQILSSQNLPYSQSDQDFSFSSRPPPNDGLLPSSMTPAFTLMSPPSATLSQSQSSQRSRKKKKRIGGFG